MLLSEFLTTDFIGEIPYIKENELENVSTIYNWILSKGYSKIVSSNVELVVNGVMDKQTLANIISFQYATKWKNVRDITNENIALNSYTQTTTTNDNEYIYGYNGEKAPNNEKEITITQTKEYYDIFGQLKKNIDFRDIFSYYNVIVTDILKFLTIQVY